MKHAVIVGGGVAGSVAAVALRRAGLRVTIFEEYADPAGDVGSFVSVSVNGLRALRAIDCLDPVLAAGFPVPRMQVWSGSGRRLGDVIRGGLPGDDPSSVTIMRGRLVAVLREQAQLAGATIVTGARLTDARVTAGGGGAGGVEAVFADGAVVSADLLIGADGLWSRTREIIDSEAPQPEFAGLYSVSGTADPAEVSIAPGVFHLVFGAKATFIYVRDPGGTVWWSAQVNSPEEPDRAELAAAVGADGWRDQLATLVGDATPAARLVRATEWFHTPTLMHLMKPVPVWHRGPMIVIGDAAHAVGAGQGASMAIEDGVVLGRCLAGAAPVADAFAAFETARRARTERAMKMGEQNKDAKTPGPIARRFTELGMRVFFRYFQAKAMGWLYTYDAGSVEPPVLCNE